MEEVVIAGFAGVVEILGEVVVKGAEAEVLMAAEKRLLHW